MNFFASADFFAESAAAHQRSPVQHDRLPAQQLHENTNPEETYDKDKRPLSQFD